MLCVLELAIITGHILIIFFRLLPLDLRSLRAPPVDAANDSAGCTLVILSVPARPNKVYYTYPIVFDLKKTIIIIIFGFCGWLVVRVPTH